MTAKYDPFAAFPKHMKSLVDFSHDVDRLLELELVRMIQILALRRSTAAPIASTCM